MQGSKFKKWSKYTLIAESALDREGIVVRMKGINDKKAAKLLVAMGSEFGYGGIEEYLINTFRNINLESLDKSLYVPGQIVSKERGERMEENGFRIYADDLPSLRVDLPPTQHLLFYGKMIHGLHKVLREEEYDIFYVNTGGVLLAAVLVSVARICNVPNRIVHAHNTAIKGSAFKEFIRACCRRIIVRNSTKRIGCSRDAANYFFGKRAGERTKIIHCGIDVRRFAFHKEIRDQLRKALGLEDNLVVGHIGRFNIQKNHSFLLCIFKEVLKRDPSARLVLFGSGELEEDIRQQVKDLKIDEEVLFMGNSDRIQDYMCAMDVFLLPSLFEGFGIVNIEAQASGLPCVISDAIPAEVRITELVRFISLSSPAQQWADEIIHASERMRGASRKDMWKPVLEAKFDISSTSQEIASFIQGSITSR